jgi:hypothetical protein
MSNLKNSLAYAINENVFGKPVVIKFLNLFIKEQNEESYDLAISALDAANSLCKTYALELGLSESRILATLSDGTVWYDSNKINTYEKYKSKSINENHESRYSIRQAMDSYEGIGWESKFSSTENKFENYYAVRGGDSPNEIAYVVRLAFN